MMSFDAWLRHPVGVIAKPVVAEPVPVPEGLKRCTNAYRYCQGLYDPSSKSNRRLCAECLARRREKQRNTAMQPTCHCGNKMSMDVVQCRGCDWKDEQREIELNRLAYEMKRRMGK